MTTHSYGLLPWRSSVDGLEILLGHMGGPFWASKDAGAWTIPKGLPEGDESPLHTAQREFAEELGLPAPTDGFVDLGEVVQSGGKTVRAWAVEHAVDPESIRPGTFGLVWPPRSGRVQSFPEIDRVRWMSPDRARAVIVAAQAQLLDRLVALLDLQP
ncbi:MAG: NUDIX domain-containing protein [Aeromicrobium sp.]